MPHTKHKMCTARRGEGKVETHKMNMKMYTFFPCSCVSPLKIVFLFCMLFRRFRPRGEDKWLK